MLISLMLIKKRVYDFMLCYHLHPVFKRISTGICLLLVIFLAIYSLKMIAWKFKGAYIKYVGGGPEGFTNFSKIISYPRK